MTSDTAAATQRPLDIVTLLLWLLASIVEQAAAHLRIVCDKRKCRTREVFPLWDLVCRLLIEVIVIEVAESFQRAGDFCDGNERLGAMRE